MSRPRSDIAVFGTCPPSAATRGPDCLERVREVAQWSDRAGYEGVLQLSESIDRQEVYWMRPFKNHKTLCPNPVGDYATVGRGITRYFDLGYRTLILDTPTEEQDLMHTAAVPDTERSRSGECV